MTSGDDTWFTPAGGGGGIGGRGFREEPAREIGGWRIHALVGEGSFGRVFLAYKGQRRGALKVLRPDLVTHDNADAFRKSFESEAWILSQLGGANTAELIESDIAGYQPWLVTRFVPGDTLAYQVKFENPIRGRAWWDLAHGLFSGLAEAHSKGIIHRDIKPSNVMRSADVPAIIIDFGIALFASSVDIWNRAGTDKFQSPEQRNGADLTAASDIYSAALTLLYVRTKPTSRERKTFTQHDAPGVPFVDDVCERSSVEADVLRRALALDPASRPSAEKMVEMCALWRARHGDEPVRLTMALPPVSSAPPPGVMSHGLPEEIPMARPTKSARQVTWSQVESAVSRLLTIRPGQAARFRWDDGDIDVSVFGLHTEHIVVELQVSRHLDDATGEQLLSRGWAPPERAVGGSWLLVVPGGRKARIDVTKALIGVLRDVVTMAPSRPERS